MSNEKQQYWLFVHFHFRSSIQVSSSQISRFFTHSSKLIDETHRKTDIVTQSRSSNAESNDCSKAAITTNGDNDSQPLCNIADDQLDENKSHGNKRKHRSKCDKKTDSKTTIKSFFSNELNDSLADFELPTKVAKKVPKVLPSKVMKSSRSRRKQQPDIRKALTKEDAARSDDYSHLPEDAQLELALAISKAESINGIADGGSIDLDAFAYKPINSKSSTNADALSFFNMNRQTKTRFKWNSKCTQLTRRNDDVQKSKVRDKIDEILLNNIIVESNQADRLKSSERIVAIEYSPHCVHSRRLQRICIAERILFERNHCDKNTKTDLRSYYTNNLVDASELGAEALLKDWSKIPGRDSIFDGIQATANEIIESDATTVISSSPEYDIQTESSLSEFDAADKRDDQIENTFIVTTDQRSAGCSNATQFSQMAAMEIENDGAAQSTDDQDRTLIMDLSDIQSKIDAINSKIRTSQQFGQTLQESDFTCQAATTTRAPSPDLFDDDDDDDNDAAVKSDGIRKNYRFVVL